MGVCVCLDGLKQLNRRLKWFQQVLWSFTSPPKLRDIGLASNADQQMSRFLYGTIAKKTQEKFIAISQRIQQWEYAYPAAC